jgi:hypothetical protein
MPGNQEKQLLPALLCQYFTDISVSDDKSAYLGMFYKVSTVICIGSCFARTLYVINVSAFTLVHFSTASLFSVYHPMLNMHFIHKLFYWFSLLKVLSLL